MSNRPLLDNQQDAERFFGRSDVLGALGRAVSHGENVLIVGMPGMGRTSVLHRFARLARMEPKALHLPSAVSTTYARVEGAMNAEQLLRRVLSELTGKRTEAEADERALLEMLALARHPPADTDASGHEKMQSSHVLLVDDVSAAAGADVFGRLRDEVWESGFIWVVSARVADSRALTMPPANAFFEETIALRGLQFEHAHALLCDRAGVELAADVSKTLGAGKDTVSPRQLIGAIRAVENFVPTVRELAMETMDAARAERQRVLGELGRPAWMLYTELESRGPVSASDEELQRAMGWTRPRLVQVLAQLEEAGLVGSATAKAERGRPKRIYETKSLTDFAMTRFGGSKAEDEPT